MFKRPEENYKFDKNIIDLILKDESSTLNRILHLIKDNSKVLDIGAGNGLLAIILKKEYPNIVIDGIEPNNFAYDIAKEHYRKLYCGYAQDILGEIAQENYDFIVLADVIEHIVDPMVFLQDLILSLSMKTQIIITVPNIAFASVRFSLIEGNFDYVDSGLLERTHLRFFTKKTLIQMLIFSKVYINKLYYLNRSIFKTEINIIKIKINPISFYYVMKDNLANVYQFLVVISKNESPTEEVQYGNKDRFSSYIKYFIKRYILQKFRGTK